MLHWLQPNTPNRHILFIELLFFSVLAHGIIFCVFLYYDTSHQSLYTLTLKSTTVDLVESIVVPFVQLPQQVIKKKEAHKNVPAAAIKKMPKQKEVPQKGAPKKNTLDQKKELKKTQPIAKPKEIKKETPKVVPPHNMVTQKEYDALELQQFLQSELHEHWQPPAGLAKDLSCEVLVSLDVYGKIKSIEFIVPSGVFIYDVHAESTLAALQYPKQAWGKQLSITFKQT